MSPILSLRAAILTAVAGDAELAALMGGAVRLHDEPPRAAEPVYALFGDVTAEDDSTGTEAGCRQDFAIVVWGIEGSARAALQAAERFAVLLHGSQPALSGHRLVNLRVRTVAAMRDERSGLSRVTLRLTAVTEPA